MHVLPKGLHRIRHYGLLASGNRTANLARMRELLGMPAPAAEAGSSATTRGTRKVGRHLKPFTQNEHGVIAGATAMPK
jgi:hypothetical protein